MAVERGYLRNLEEKSGRPSRIVLGDPLPGDVSLGGSQHPSNKRWLCRCAEHRCHDRLGARRDRFGVEADKAKQISTTRCGSETQVGE